MRGELITITQQMEDFAITVAENRTKNNRNLNVENQLADRTRDNELAGVRAEIAVRQFLELPVTYEILCLPWPDYGYDIEQNGFTIDVKFTWHEEGNLIFSKATKFRARAAVLVCATEYYSQLRIAGIISKRKFMENFRWLEVPYSAPQLCVPQSMLSPLFVLQNFLTERKNHVDYSRI